VANRAVIIEDEEVFRRMLSMALGRLLGVLVAATFENGKEGLEFCLKNKPDLMVVDLFLPGMHGLDIVKEVRAKLPSTRILVVTGHPDGDLPARLIAQGVHGFVDKEAPLSYALQAVESVMNGGMFFTSHVPPKPTAASHRGGRKIEPEARTGPATPAIAAVEVLSARELEVARLVAEGSSSKEIAARLDLSVRTVEKHRANIMDKIGVREVASLVRWCIQNGIVKGA
jgi:DNA-binding NarL/FixJ family response regulator